MPGVTLHFVLADRALHRWRMGTAAPPFDLDDPAALNAFYHGSVGPDLGYFPGGCRVLSDLAHCVRTGTLVRSMLHGARTVRERAFALGWLSHALADQAIHPWIGRGVGELLTGSRHRFVDGASHPLAHLRVEMGLDASCARSHPEVPVRRLFPAFRDRELGFLVRAYATTYGVAVPTALFARSHRAATRGVGQALASLALLSALMGGGGFPVVPALRRALSAAYGRKTLRSVALAYLNPVAPPPWLLDAVGRAAARQPDTFLSHVREDARALQDVNLDTGRLLADETDHPGTLKALTGLRTLAATASRTRRRRRTSALRRPCLPELASPLERPVGA